ncbi:cell-cell signaling protein CsgA [Veronia nyctiphanis]|uniref:Cell-cell signaling protein CsgA n=1 Tax=Veronia nyctiphanis TaxID=1278244 RepID=A0A4Q0YSZ7_9GAMM|nr:SDR family NAD(P)-dependent oxidoreductase [Veronia nyctiphanis]RXJ72239.1 cell-cell signaling protein CsgA [Veronia nyctiphanis]
MAETLMVAGSHGTIAKALIERLYESGYRIVTVSRYPEPHNLSSSHLVTALADETSVDDVKNWLKKENIKLSGVICCCGQLYDETNLPEKNLKQLKLNWLQESLKVNVATHVHLAQGVAGFISSKSNIRWLSLSAKVGSIEDNQLGGWYSYRMSKAALNMFLKNLSIEWQRRAPGCSVIAVHPGTTPSALSAPFTKNWPKDKLYEDTLTAQRIAAIFASQTPYSSGKLYHHDGTVIPW